ncbi:hypothetical protein GCM10010869_47990 [Mesorhizobium tianshanense]|uniref:AlpA family transcriptional regulator n=1 Tax=Mesorhizobium tianshanense TaxID=39844 RepID=A0A562NSV5_9HYPH|nr:hypothetical protein [Mesorhizobium tianshanense]TWI35297.1 hypothetical protein IQ26_03277 [Mesorhizobium tianshanense]GLS39202.1 hypothetical protein GCM10010869_47990 [Mesorhizobium tianshanense]
MDTVLKEALEHAMKTTPSDIDSFCRRYGFSRSSYYVMRDKGYGPRELVIGRLVRITAEAEAEWLHEREAAAERRRALREATPSARRASRTAA